MRNPAEICLYHQWPGLEDVIDSIRLQLGPGDFWSYRGRDEWEWEWVSPCGVWHLTVLCSMFGAMSPTIDVWTADLVWRMCESWPLAIADADRAVWCLRYSEEEEPE